MRGDGKWWWAHEQVCPDIAGSPDDSNRAMKSYDRLKNPQPGPGGPGGPGGPEGEHGPQRTDKATRHRSWSVIQPVQYTVVPPEPYAHMDEENTCSPGYNTFDEILPQNRQYGGDVIKD